MKEGRPTELSSGKRGQNFSIYVDPEQMNVLEEIRWREHKSMSAVIRKAMSEYIKSHAEGNDSFKLDKWNDDENFKAIPTLYSKSESWYQYISECTEEELTDIMVKTKHINDQCQAESRKRK